MNEAENKALFWLKDENAIQRNVRRERSGKRSVTEHDLSGGQSALIDILRSGSPINQELRDALASALDPIGNSLLQLKKRLRRRPGRPSKIDDLNEACRNAYEVHSIGPKIEQERRSPKAKRPQAAAGTRQKKPTREDAIKIIASENKIGRTKAYALDKGHRNALKNKMK
jgi:hypothetical protein